MVGVQAMRCLRHPFWIIEMIEARLDEEKRREAPKSREAALLLYMHPAVCRLY